MKKRFLTVALAATMVLSSVVPAMAESNLENGLVGYYTFDDTLENAIGDGTAKLHGGAGDTWNQAATGTATYVTGKNGKAYSFAGDVMDGTTLVSRGEGLELDAKVTGSESTISAWISVDSFGVGTSSLIFGTGTINTDNDACFSVNSLNGFNGSVLFGKIWDWDNRNDTFVCLDGDNTGNKFTNNSQFVYVTITCKEGEQKLYFNGVEHASSASTNALVYDNLKNTVLFLGINWWDASFKGAMDDVAVYNRVLSAAEVADLYAANGVPVTAEPTPSETEDATETGDMTAVLPVAILAVAAMAVVVVMRKRTVAE